MDDAIRKIIDFMKQYPFVPYEHREDAIRAFPSSETGFEVALLANGASYTVCYATWHSEFCDTRMALNAFINGLSDGVRLKVATRGAWITAGEFNFESLKAGLAGQRSSFFVTRSGKRRRSDTSKTTTSSQKSPIKI